MTYRECKKHDESNFQALNKLSSLFSFADKRYLKIKYVMSDVVPITMDER